ncbi:MAG: transposase, partial [Oscillospiraceae bacterium]|nr:transposase [Oscillospiraceae bacterium]
MFCEKPLALTAEQATEIVELGRRLGLRVCVAPDTFLGPGIQTCRKIIDEGLIGEIVGFTANLDTPGHESWHPSPLFYYQPGGGPMRDMGPYYLTALISLLGPAKEVFCYTSTSFPTRMIKGQEVEVNIPTHYAGLMKMKSGIFGNISVTTAIRYFSMVNYSCKVLPEVLSIDEFKCNAGGEKYQSIITDAKNRKVIDILPNRKKSDLIRYFKQFDNRKNVKYVVMDMNPHFREVAQICFPNATIVIDRYHVTRQAIWAMERVRKAEQKAL